MAAYPKLCLLFICHKNQLFLISPLKSIAKSIFRFLNDLAKERASIHLKGEKDQVVQGAPKVITSFANCRSRARGAAAEEHNKIIRASLLNLSLRPEEQELS